MTVRAVAFSHAALFVDQAGLQSEIRELLEWLAGSDVEVAVLSTHARDIDGHMLARAYPAAAASIFRDHPLVGGKNKGAPEWMTATAAELGVNLSECFSVGVSFFDWLSAVNAGMLYVHAGWAGPRPHKASCLVADTPRDLAWIASHFLLEPPRWSFKLDDPSRRYRLRCLLPASARLPATNPREFKLQDVFTYDRPVVVGDDSAQDILMLHALSSAYLEGLIPTGSFFVVYPGSVPGSISRQVQSFLRPASSFFHAYVRTRLLERAVRAPDTSLMRARARSQGREDPSTMLNQSNTVRLDPKFTGKLAGRTVVVFDDFTTTGMSLEWARNLLMLGAAESVVGLSIGKYSSRYRFYDLDDADVEPYSINTLTEEDFVTESVQTPEVRGNAERLYELLDSWVTDR